MTTVERKNNLARRLMVGLVACGLLAAAGLFLRAATGALKKENASNLKALGDVLPGFNKNSVVDLQQEIEGLKAELLGLSAAFDPKYKWVKKDYDLSIYFVEEVGKARQFLKSKAEEKRLTNPDLGFKEKLPSESEAASLLTQLYGLKEVIALGLNDGANFKSVNPYAEQPQSPMPQVKILKSTAGLSLPAETLIDFIIQLNEIIPKVCFESLSVKSEGAFFSVDMTLAHVLIDADVNAREQAPPSAPIKDVAASSRGDFARILRNKSPFFIPPKPEISVSEGTEEVSRPAKPAVRFIYRGKAKLKNKEVVVIEDTLKQETVFLGKGEKIEDLVLNDFSDNRIILQNINSGQEIIIKREEE